MKNVSYDEHISFVLPDSYTYKIEEDESEKKLTLNYMPNEDSENYVCQCIYIETEPDFAESPDKLIDEMINNFGVEKFVQICDDPRTVLFRICKPMNVLGVILNTYANMAFVQIDDRKVYELTSGNISNNDHDQIEALDFIIETLRSMRLDGNILPLNSIDTSLIDNIIPLAFDQEEDFETMEPDMSLYPHYASLKNNFLRHIPGVVINASGTEYEFYKFSLLLQTADQNRTELLKRVLDSNPSGYSLGSSARKMMKLFRVDRDVFNARSDRECELYEGYMRRAYMMSALRSFAWTLSSYCEKKGEDPSTVDIVVLKQMIDFVAEKDWLNYNGESYCKGLCSGSDLHVYFLPDNITSSDRKQFLPSVESRQYNSIVDEIHSLDELRSDLNYLYPAIKTIYKDLAKDRDRSVALEGNESDILYAFIALATAAEEPFYSEDGPMSCYHSWLGEEEEYQRNIEKKWMEQYGSYLERDPVINFNGSTFVLSGYGRSLDDDSNDIVNRIKQKGGEIRSKVSGLTDYLVVNPASAGSTKVNSFIEQRNKGKNIKLVLGDDLEKALGIVKENDLDELLSEEDNDSSTENREQFDPDVYNTRGDYSIYGGEINDYSGNDTNVTVPYYVDTLGTAFKSNKSIKSVIIPEGMTRIGSFAFSKCENLETVILPNSIKAIEDYAFADCKAIKTFVFPELMDEVGCSIFSNCEKLESVELPRNLQKISEAMFFSCISLHDLVIPESVKSIEDNAFFDCKQLKSIIIPDNVETIGENAFKFTKIVDIFVPASVKVISKDAFKTGSTKTVIHLIKGSKAEDIVKETGIKYDYMTIEEWKEKEQELPDEDCNEIYPLIEKVLTDDSMSDSEKYDRIKDLFITMEDTPMERFFISEDEDGRKIAKEYLGSSHFVKVSDGLEELDETFFNDDNVEAVFIPDSIRKIYSAFSKCKNLKCVIMPESLDYYDVDFSECTSISFIKIPKTETLYFSSFGWAFDKCTKLKTIIFEEGTESAIIGSQSWPDEGPRNLVVSLPDSLKEIDNRSGKMIPKSYFSEFHVHKNSIAEKMVKEAGYKYKTYLTEKQKEEEKKEKAKKSVVKKYNDTLSEKKKMDDDILSYRKNLSEYEDELGSLNELIKVTNEAIINLNSRYEAKEAELNDQLEALNKKKDIKKNEISTVENRLTSMSFFTFGKKKKVKAELNQLGEEARAIDKEIDSVQSLVFNLNTGKKKDFRNKNNELKEAVEKADKLKNEINHINFEITELENKIPSLDKKLSDLEVKLKTFE